LDTEFEAIFGQTVCSRLFLPHMRRILDTEQVKEILLFERPEKAETQTVRQIKKMHNTVDPKYMNREWAGSPQQVYRQVGSEGQQAFE
jgi:hypothetical protein